MHTEILLRDEAVTFFRAFVDAFGSFDGGVVAALFHTPYLAVNADGSSKVLFSAAEVAQYFQKYLDNYKADGCVACTFDNLDVVAIGKKHGLFTVTWQLFSESGTEISSWRESYSVVRANNGALAYASVDHAT